MVEATTWKLDRGGNLHATAGESVECCSCDKPVYDSDDAMVGVRKNYLRQYMHLACAKREGVLW